MFKIDTYLMIFILILIILSAFLSLDLYLDFNKESGRDILNLIGGAIGGSVGPLIALDTAIIMYLAFKKQDETNKLVKKQFEKEQVYSRFYEMLKVYSKIVDRFNRKELDDSTINAENQFKELLSQFDTIYTIVINSYNLHLSHDLKDWIKENKEVSAIYHNNFIIRDAYWILFFGIEKFQKKMQIIYSENLYMYTKFSGKIEKYEKYIYNELESINKKEHIGTIYSVKNKLDVSFEGVLKLGLANDSFLSKYYRHLFSMVRFIVDSKTLTYKEKRDVLKILRSLLSNEEQILLYYNWLADFGAAWEIQAYKTEKDNGDNEELKGNRFFSDFRMIHNLREDLIKFEELQPGNFFKNQSMEFLYFDDNDKELFEVIGGFESTLDKKYLRKASCERKEKISDLSFFCEGSKYIN